MEEKDTQSKNIYRVATVIGVIIAVFFIAGIPCGADASLKFHTKNFPGSRSCGTKVRELFLLLLRISEDSLIRIDNFIVLHYCINQVIQ